MTPDVVPLGASENPEVADARMDIELWRAGEPSPRLAVVAHGRNGAAHAPHMQKLIDSYRARDYIVLSPDCCASAWNDSAGKEADFLLENHVRDVRRTVDWALANAAAVGWDGTHLALCGHSMGAYAAAKPLVAPPPTTALGALIAHITGGHLEGGSGSFQPMNINYGLLPPMEAPKVDGEGKKVPVKERGPANPVVLVEVRSVYGNTTIYPANAAAERFAAIAGKKTLSNTDLMNIQALGFVIEEAKPNKLCA